MGESQSALYLTTYVNEVDPVAEVYDGFLVHSRFGPSAPLDGSSISMPHGGRRYRSSRSVPICGFRS
jgi:hypothetical protein